MGTWGVGMQSNDTALDVIGDGRKPLENLQENIDEWMKDDKYGNGRKSILGLAEFCLDKRKKLTPDLIKKIKVVLKRAKAQAEDWSESEDRLAALQRFEDRLNGKKVSKEDLAKDNEGLLSKICSVTK